MRLFRHLDTFGLSWSLLFCVLFTTFYFKVSFKRVLLDFFMCCFIEIELSFTVKMESCVAANRKDMPISSHVESVSIFMQSFAVYLHTQ